MLGNVAQAATVATLLHSTAAANTAAATGTAVDVTDYEGYLLVTQHANVTTGSLDGKIQHSTTTSATDFTDITGATFTSVTTANDVAALKLCLPVNGVYQYIRYLGTVTTGPVTYMSVTFAGVKKYVP